MKKVLCLMLSILLLFACPAFAEEDEPAEGFDLAAIDEDFVYVFNLKDPSRSVCGLEKNADEKCYPASTTKILTCIIALENGDLAEEVKVASAADSDRIGGTTAGIHKNEVYTLEELLYGMMLPSGNDCATAIAFHLGGSLEGFADMMNEKAADLGMEHSHFVTPSGLHRDEHYTTARDMALLTAYAMQNETFRTIVGTAETHIQSKSGGDIRLRSSNRFLRNYVATTYKPESVLYEEAIGVKTGETNQAGKCLIAAARRQNAEYGAVLLHGTMPPSRLAAGKKKDAYSTRRYKDARKLLEYAFDHDIATLTAAELAARGLETDLSVTSPKQQPELLSAELSIDWDSAEPFSAPVYSFPAALFSGEDPNAWLTVSYSGEPFAPDAVVGSAQVTIDGTVYFTAPVVCRAVVLPTPTPSPSPTPRPTPTAPPTVGVEAISFETPAPQSTQPPRSFWDFLSCAPRG